MAADKQIMESIYECAVSWISDDADHPDTPPADWQEAFQIMTAAPDLLAALQAVTAYHGTGTEGVPMWDKARAAIAAATGTPAGWTHAETSAPDDPTQGLMVPTVHANGTDSQTLISGYCAAAGGLRAAIDHLQAAAPNGRDFYPQGPDAIKRADIQHRARVAQLEQMILDLMQTAERIDAQETDGPEIDESDKSPCGNEVIP